MRKYLKIKLKTADSIIKRLEKSIKIMEKIGNDDDVYSFSNEATYGEIRTDDMWERGSSRDYGILGYAMNVFYGGGGKGLVGWLGDLLIELKREDNVRRSVIDSIWRGLINKLQNEYEYDTFKKLSKKYIEDYEKNKQRIKQTLKDYIEYEENNKKYKQYVEVLDSTYTIVKDIKKWYEDLQAKMIEADKARFHDYKPQTIF
jgi:hypothetical protein